MRSASTNAIAVPKSARRTVYEMPMAKSEHWLYAM